jgi:Type IV secretory system Conjugative DNA transfer
MNSYHYGRRDFNVSREENAAAVVTMLFLAAVGLVFYILNARFHIRAQQLIEASIDLACLAAALFLATRYLLTLKRRRETAWPHPAIRIPMLKDREYVRQAFARDSVIAGYNVHGQPWFWPDETRRMQALLLGQSGSGKTTLLLNIIAQDLRRVVRGHHRIPMVIIDGKADKDFLKAVLSEVAAAGRLHQLRILDPSDPTISVRYNPLYVTDESYNERVNFIFESFGLRRDFFKGHQATYFGDLVRVLFYTGKRFNIYDVLVAALDQQVLEEQMELARTRIERLYSSYDQRRLNFDMSARNLLQSFADRERVEKIQGLLNELMSFLEDKLSVITGPYEDLLTLDDVIDQELILFVSLNVNVNARAVTALGRILLQNLQLMVGKRYEEQGAHSPFVSVILDEFSPFAYPNFAQIIQTARGTNIALLFSLQSIAQLLKVSPGFCDDVSSAPNTVMLLRVRDEATTRYFENASSLVEAKRLTMTIEERGLFDKRYEQIGFGSETEIKETRAQDYHLKNLPVGQFQILMTNNKLGTEFSHLHVRRPTRFDLACFEPMVYPRSATPNILAEGANLRFKDATVRERRPRLKGSAHPARQT